jgi:hypothetical protein
MIRARSAGFYLFLYSLVCAPSAVAQERAIMKSSQLLPGYDLGVNSSGVRTGWLINHHGYMEMSYPSGQSWGAVFVTVGRPREPPRPARDFSDFDSLLIDMRGRAGGEQIEIGIKTNTQPDDGSETKVPVTLTTDWQTYDVPLFRFTGTDARHLYVVTEFVFAGAQARTVYFRDIRYRPSSSRRQTGKSGATAVQVDAGTHAGVGPSYASGGEPSVTITRPVTAHTIKIWSGTRPSLLVQGEVEGMPNTYKLYIGVHPTTSDSVWTQEIPARRKWLTQVYLGDPGRRPKNGESFEMVGILSNRPPPKRFNELGETFDYYMSDIVTVDVSVQSWADRAGAFMRDVGVSLPISALFTSAGGIRGLIYGSRTANREGKVRAEKTPDPDPQTGA